MGETGQVSRIGHHIDIVFAPFQQTHLQVRDHGRYIFTVFQNPITIYHDIKVRDLILVNGQAAL